MNTSTKSLFLITTLMSTLMVISSSSWVNMWIGMEINLMSFIPMMSTLKNSFLSQSSMMYFLIQAMASMMFMIIMLSNKYMFINMSDVFVSNMITMTMMVKMGVPPFHMWLPEVIMKMKWNMCLMLMTWQKIAPMYVLSMFIYLNNMMITIVTMASMIGALGGINQTSTRKMMAYSSISHMSWMIASAAMFKKSWITYLVLYSTIMMLFCYLMYNYNVLYINQMNIFFMKNMDKILIISMILSMGGIPPFMGFLPKWIVLQYMIISGEMIVMTAMVIMSLITLSYYLRMSISMNMMMSQSQKWLYMTNTNKTYSMLLMMVNISLPLLILSANL